MNDVRELHNRAMDLVERGEDARRHGYPLIAMDKFTRAETLERQAANFATTEPTKSILTKSADKLKEYIEGLRTPTPPKGADEC